ncbi:unnamed protein product, partial [Rotaria magnacalcarata]
GPVNNFVFPVHHKHRKDRQSSFTQSQSDIDQIDIEQIITDAYHKTVDMLDRLEMLNLLKEKRALGLNLVSENVLKQPNSNSKMYDYSSQLSNIDDEEFELADDDDDERADDLNMDNGNNDSTSSNDDHTDDDEQDDTRNLINTTKDDYVGIKIFNTVQTHIEHSYLKVKINDDMKYMHKQTACWLLTGKKSQNPFCNSIKSLKRGQWDNCINDQSEIIIEKDSSFDYSLKTIGDFVKIRNDYDLFRSRTILETCSFSFFFFLCKRPSSKDNSWLTVTLDLIEDRPRRSRPITIYVNAERHLEFSVNYAFCIQTQHSNSPKLQFDMWYHITVLIAQTSPDDTSIELYLNSQKLADYKLSKRFRPPYHDIGIEASIRDTHLAEICIWKRKLTVKEIKTIFEQQTTLKRVDFVTDIL